MKKKSLILTTAFAMALGVGVAVGAHQSKSGVNKAEADSNVVYLKPGVWSSTGNPNFSVWNWSSDDGEFIPMTEVDNDPGVYKATLAAGKTNLIFARMNPEGSSTSWDSKWNQSDNLTFTASTPCYEISGWGGETSPGTWKAYEEPSEPVDPEYHLVGTFNEWDDSENEYILTVDLEDANHYTITDIELKGGEEPDEFKVKDTANDLWYGNHGENVSVGEDGKYDIDFYVDAKNDEHIVANKQVPPEPSYTYKMQIVGKEGLVTLVKSEEEGKENEYFLPADYHFNVGESVKFFQVQDEESTALASAPKEDGQLTKVYVSDAENHVLTFAQEFEGKLMLDINTNNVWAGQFTPGYYLAGVGSEWNPKLAKAAHKVAEEDPAYVVENVAVAAGEEVKFIYAPSALDETQNQFTWFKADKNKTSTMTNVKYTVVESEGDDDGNFKLTDAGTYNFYYTPESGWYSVENPGYQPEYTLHVGETVYDLELNEGTEYKIKDHIDVDLTKGEEVSFFIDGVKQDFTRKHIGNNNLDENFEIMSTVTAQVYVDIGAKTIFVGGLDFDGYHLLLNDEFVHMTENEEPLDPSFREYYSGMISFEQNDVVRFIDTTGNSEDGYAKVFDITNISESSAEGFAVVEGKLVAQKKVDLSVYLKLKSGQDEVYFGPVAEEIALAKQFAKQFNNSIGGVCKWDMTTDTDALGVAWQAQITLFGELAPKVQNVLKEPSETALSINEIAEFEGKYEYVAAKYGPKGILGANYNFLEKDLSKVQVSPFYGDNMFTTDSSTLIIVISSVAATSVIALGILLILKKKKHQ